MHKVDSLRSLAIKNEMNENNVHLFVEVLLGNSVVDTMLVCFHLSKRKEKVINTSRLKI